MQTESFGQMVDRLIIASLKKWHYAQDGKVEAAELAQEQAERLCVALEVYDYECRTGARRPSIQRHLRYHDHNEVEAWRAGKSATGDMPDTIGSCINRLVETHSDYWRSQSRIQTLKKLINGAPDGPNSDKPHFEHELVQEQRKHIDLDNQRRNELVEHIDVLYKFVIEKGDNL